MRRYRVANSPHRPFQRGTRLSNAASRSGWTLIETSFVISLIGILSTIGTTLFVSLMNVDSKMAISALQEVTAQRLEDQLREDTSIAIRLDQVEEGFDLIDIENHSIAYRIQGDQVIRLTAVGKKIATDTYTFVSSEIGFEFAAPRLEVFIREAIDENMVNKTVTRSNDSDSATNLIFELNRLKRFAVETTQEGQ